MAKLLKEQEKREKKKLGIPDEGEGEEEESEEEEEHLMEENEYYPDGHMEKVIEDS